MIELPGARIVPGSSLCKHDTTVADTFNSIPNGGIEHLAF
jgi:hypothetical protein